MKKKILFGLIAFIAVFAAMAFFEADTVTGLTAALVAPIAVAFPQNTELELRNAKQDLYDKANGIIGTAKTEKRSLTADEQTQYDDYLKEMRRLDEDIKRASEFEKRNLEFVGGAINKENEKKAKKEVRNYSFVKAIREANTREGLTGLEKEMAEEAQNEFRSAKESFSGQVQVPSIVLMSERRAMTATGQTSVAGDQGGMMIQTDKKTFIEALQAEMLIMKLGAQFFENLSGNVDMPRRASALYASWATENGTATELSDTLGKVTLSPKRLAAFQLLSKQLIAQTSYGIENKVRMWMIEAIALALDKAAIQGTGSNNQPTGILNISGIGSVAIDTNGGAPTWATMVKLEEEIAVDDALKGKLAIVTNQKVRSKLKRTMIDTYQEGPIWTKDNTVNGYPAYATSHVPSNLTKASGSSLSAMIMGDFSSLMIGQWGGLDLVIDPYTKADANQVKIVINSLYDVACEHPESFSVVSDIVTT